MDVLIFDLKEWIVHRIGNIRSKLAFTTAIAVHNIESTSGYTYHQLEIINHVGLSHELKDSEIKKVFENIFCDVASKLLQIFAG